MELLKNSVAKGPCQLAVNILVQTIEGVKILQSIIRVAVTRGAAIIDRLSDVLSGNWCSIMYFLKGAWVERFDLLTQTFGITAN